MKKSNMSEFYDIQKALTIGNTIYHIKEKKMKKYIFNQVHLSFALYNKKWSIDDLSNKSGVGKNNIYKFKNHLPRIDIARSIADALGVDVGYLWQTEEEFKKEGL